MKHANLKINMSIFLLVLCGIFSTLGLSAQTGSAINIKGNVKDATGEAFIGAIIQVQNTSLGTVTDIDGNFAINAPSDGVLEVKYLGYKTQIVPINGKTSFDITLAEDSEILDELVVIGYGAVKKNDVTGSVIAMSPDDMNKGLTLNAQDMIVGKIPGVSVISDGGTPGGGAQIRVRGGSSLSASNDPLIVIDGLPMDNEGVKGLSNPLSMVNPNDIETFTVLKDASATAIYGSRASNGVIIITTKRGKAGQGGKKVNISYNGNVSVSQVRNTLDVLNGDEYRALMNEMYAGRDEVLGRLGTANTDWQDEIYRTAVSTDHNITITGAAPDMPYRFSFGYTNQDGVVKTSNFERYTGSFNLSPTLIKDRLTLNINAKFMYAKNRYADGGAIGSAVAMDPTQSVYSNSEAAKKYYGGYFQWGTSASSLNDPTWTEMPHTLAVKNPVSILELKDDRAVSKSFIGNVEGDYKFWFLPDLRWHASFGGDASSGRQTTDISKYSGTNNYYGHNGYSYQSKYNLAFNTYLQYAKTFGVNNIDIMGGYEWQHFYRRGSDEGYGIYPETNKEKPGELNGYSNKTWKTESYLVSFFGRLNYTLLDRYLITATLRDDGSSRFHKDNRWGLFPSAALAWKVKEESFLKNVDVLSDLKLRLGYGITGQQNINQGDYPYIPSYIINEVGAYYPLGDEYYTLYRPKGYNKDLKWEKTTTYNIGLDFGFLNGRITGAVDVYQRETDDLLNVVDVPAGTNFTNKVISNIGSLENKGIEFFINAKPIVTRDFVWDLGFNVTANKNKITKLTTGTGEGYYVETGGISSGTGNNIQAHMVGHPASSFYVYQQVYDENGKPIENEFVDRDGDGSITVNDKYIYKKPTADVLMGLTSKFMYKGWDLGFSLRASLGNYVYNDVLANNAKVGENGFWDVNGYFVNRPVDAVNLGFTGTTGQYFMSDYFVQDASFLRCDNITLGYSFNKLFGHISGRVYGTVQNVFVITKYDGLDPELNSGIDNNIYPRPFVGIFGVNLNF